jgi:hypothetical protein
MPIPEASREDLLAAIERFDREFRESPEFAGWEDRLTYRYAIEHEGRRYPVKKIVSLASGAPTNSFFGGSEANDYVSARGLAIVTLRSQLLRDSFEKILRDYPTARTSQPFGHDNAILEPFRKCEATLASPEVLGNKPIQVKASIGQGNWAKVPWIAFLDSRETDSTQRGVYVVLLFRQDGSGLYLTLNQGVTVPLNKLGQAAGRDRLRQHAREIRTRPDIQVLEGQGFRSDDEIDLRADPGLGKDYEASTIVYKLYEKDAVPDDTAITADVQALLTAYDAYLSSQSQAVHLLLKWSPEHAADTIERHKQVAQERGSVWWGKFGKLGISEPRLIQIRTQLGAGMETSVFLSGADTLWRTRLEQITSDADDVDDALLPGYYRKEDCSFFVRLVAFEPVARRWFEETTVLDSDPVPGSGATALKSHANPAYVRLVGEPADRRAWIFQGNPSLFDTRTAITALKSLTWLAKQHAGDMKVGDQVYIWESGAAGGVVALAEITAGVTDSEQDEESRPFNRAEGQFAGVLPRVTLEIKRIVNPPLGRNEIRSEPDLAELSILRFPQGTNFSVTDGERKALDRLLTQRGSAPVERELCLIGTSRGAVSRIEQVTQAIREKGGWGFPWSFPIKADARPLLQTPFFLYLYVGNQRVPVRVRVVDYRTSAANDGLQTPWPEMTDAGWLGKTRSGQAAADIFKTWFKVDAYELLDPELTIQDFEPAEGLSGEHSLLSAVTFGYAYRRQERSLDELVSHTLLERSFVEKIVSALTKPVDEGGSPQIVLAGPPGTSKTWVAEAVARYIAGHSKRIRLVQFHPNYSYEAFVEGIRPVAENGAISFRRQDGALLSIVADMQKAEEAEPGSPLYALIIDEMNRANLPRVFGELMYLFEYRSKTIRLQYSDEFFLPPNLRFIATMNTADRSIRSIDIALRRRFDVFELTPDAEVLRRYFEKHQLRAVNLIEGFEKLNERLERDLDRHHTIGHAFFMKPRLDRGMLRAVWDRKVYPLIEEYFFDQLDIARKEYTFEAFWPE